MWISLYVLRAILILVSEALSPHSGDNAERRNAMHKNTKLTPVLRREVFKRYRSGKYSLRDLGVEYHVDKKVIARIVARGEMGDFSVHSSVNHRFVKKRVGSRQRVTVPKQKRATQGRNAKRV